MGWKEILGRREVQDTEPELCDRQQILAYLEELGRLRTLCQLRFRSDDIAPATVRVELVSEEAETFTVSLSRALPPDIEDHPSLEFTFPLDKGRFRCSVHYHQRGGYLQAVLGLPLRIKLAERRSQPRARFGPRERASVTLLESLGRGVGASGKVRDLSMNGLSLRVDRMISIGDDHRIPPSLGHFQSGQRFLLVRINDLPRAPMLECGGCLAHAVSTPEGIVLGLQFEGVGALELRILEQVLQRRLPSTGHRFPVRQRKSHAGGPEEPEPEAAEWDEPEEEGTDAPAPEPDPAVPALPEADLDTGPDRMDPRERVQRLKRAGRTLLLVMGDDLDRAILAGTLIVDGFRRLREARNFTDAVDALRSGQPDLLILDQRIGGHDAQAFLERLRQHGLDAQVPVVLLAEKSDVRVALMAKAARIAHAQPKPVDYDGALRGALERLLKLQ